jgi:hypothetical protein
VATPLNEACVLLIALLLTLLMSALGAAFSLVAASETLIARNFVNSEEALAAARAAAERAIADLDALPDWNLVINGTVRSTFTDGLPVGARQLADGTSIDLAQVVNLANCHKTTACTAAEMDATTPDRPWAANNPRWQPFMYGKLRNIVPGRVVDSSYYVVVLVADDPSEQDDDPSRDSDAPNPGAGVMVVRAQALGVRAAQKTIELTVARTSAGHCRVIAWRPI